MKLGVAIASDNALPSAFVVMRGLEKSIKLAHEFGYDGVELALKEPDEMPAKELLDLLKKNSLQILRVFARFAAAPSPPLHHYTPFF